MSTPLHVPYFGRVEKEYRNRRVVRLQVLIAVLPPEPEGSVAPVQSSRTQSRRSPQPPHGYRRRVFNGLDGRTARREKPSHRPAGLIRAVGRNVSKYVAGLPARTDG